jgi:adenine-specific DNA-methyltransferase
MLQSRQHARPHRRFQPLADSTWNVEEPLIDPVNDYLIWFAKDVARCSNAYTQLFEKLELTAELTDTFSYAELSDGKALTLKQLSDAGGNSDYRNEPSKLLLEHPGARIFASTELTAGGFRKNQSKIYRYQGREFDPGLSRGNCWKHTAVTEDGSPSGMDRLAQAARLFAARGQLRFKRYHTDFGYQSISNWWDGIGGAKDRLYVVQTSVEVIRRCILMTTRPGDLVLDPTCGSGTTALVAEQWGRRWITIDTSRVPLALARQRLLTATFPYYQLKEESRGPAGGFIYERRQNRNGEEVGGIVPHITSSTIANNEPPSEEVLVDRPEEDSKITRVAGPFCVEATIPTPLDIDGDGAADAGAPAEDHASFIDRMLEVLRKSPVIQIGGGKTVAFKNVRPPAKTLSLSAEATVTNGADKPAAIVFGPENGAISEKLVYEAAREAHAKGYSHLYVIGFNIQPHARKLVDDCEAAIGVAATYVQATPDLMMGDLLKTMRSSQIFSVCGKPDVKLRKAPPAKPGEPQCYQVELLGCDVFDPITMENDHRAGADVPAWLLDTDYNNLVFHGVQVFFPRTSAWDNLKKALKATHDESVWDHLAGTVSAPFEAGEHGQIAVKVIDDRGNELLVVMKITEATP